MRIAIIGGDMRMIIAGDLLATAGYSCYGFGFGECISKSKSIKPVADIQTAVNGSDAVILPFPCEKDGYLNAPYSQEKIAADDIFSYGNENTLFIGGRLPKNGRNIEDYSEREEFLLRNAVPTAEGAIAIAINETKTTLRNANTVVIGYGRIGHYLATCLKALGANVTVIARRLQSRAQAEISGINAVGFEDIEAPLSAADIVFNTVPVRVLNEKELSALKKGTAIVELASFPGGADEELARVYNINLIKALGLPGKVAPASAGKAVFETVLSILTERGITP